MSADGDRVGILGGTFDPIHDGHLAAAEAACGALRLDRVLLVPSHLPPHRPLEPRVSAFHRFAMVSLAIGDHPRLGASDIELTAPGPSFTAVTLRTLQTQGLTPVQIFFIIGTDAFAEIATWYDYPAVLDLAHFVVIARQGQSFDQVRGRLPQLAHRMTVAPARGERTASPVAIHLVQAQTPAVSSTEIRAIIAARGSISGMVPPMVERHIGRHRLYEAGRGPLPEQAKHG